MKSNIITLSVEFDTKENEVLYDGEIWYRKNLIDMVRITADKIILTCQRANKADENFIFSPNSPARNELYKAAVFYLCVTGAIPTVKRISLKNNDDTVKIDKDRLTRQWKGIKIEIPLDKTTAARCFFEDGKICYIAMTFFLKAQMGSFSNDRFRAAWSGLNALYNPLTENNHDSDGLKKLRSLIKDNGLSTTEKYLEESGSKLWDYLQWHNFIQTAERGCYKKKVAERLISSYYQDYEVYSHLARYSLEQKARYDKQKDKRNEEQFVTDNQVKKLTDCLKKQEKARKTDYREQASFIITEYCYAMRNRTFHGARPYPVFRTENDKEEIEEQMITDVLLHTISDLLDSFDVLKERYAIHSI